LCLVSCGGGSDEGGGNGSSPTDSASTNRTGTSSPPPSSGGGPRSGGSANGGGTGGSSGSDNGNDGGGGDGYSYLPWGPGDPPIPGQYAAFAATSSHDLDCNTVQDQAPDGGFWGTALAVCRAIRDGAPWPDSTTLSDPPAGENAFQDCLNAELGAMLQRALRWHTDHPGRRPRISYPARSSTSPCQSRIYRTRVLTVAEAEEADPDHAGKIAVVVTAPPDKDGELAVAVDGQQPDDNDVVRNINDPGDGLTELTVFLDPPQQPSTAKIAVFNGRGGPMTTRVDLPGAGESTSPPATENPTPEQTDGQTGSASESAPPNG
jgi:hypothetical protein